jgi:hypothetical protein
VAAYVSPTRKGMGDVGAISPRPALAHGTADASKTTAKETTMLHFTIVPTAGPLVKALAT